LEWWWWWWGIKKEKTEFKLSHAKKKALGIKVKVNLRHLRLPPLYK
jgi:hypothetical protein